VIAPRRGRLGPVPALRAVACVLAALALAGCAATPEPTDVPLAGTRWQMIEASFALAPPPAPRPTLEFRADRLSAASGCNLAMGSYRTAAGRLDVGQLAATRRACPPDIDRVERAWFALLGEGPGYEVQGNVLVLTGRSARARLVRLPTAGGEAISAVGDQALPKP